MSQKIENKPQASVYVVPALRDGLASFFGEESMLLQLHRREGLSVNQQELYGFQDALKLALISFKVDEGFSYWHHNVLVLRERLRKEFYEVGDALTAMEVDDAYCDYLVKIDDIEGAILVAEHITDDYEASLLLKQQEEKPNDPHAMRMAQFVKNQAMVKKPQALARIQYYCLEKGLQEEAEAIKQKINLDEHGYHYYAGLFNFYKKSGDIKRMEALAHELEPKVNAWKDDTEKEFQFRLFRMILNNCREYLGNVINTDRDSEAAWQKLKEINVDGAKFAAQIEFIEKKVQEDIKQAKVLCLELIKEIHVDVDQRVDIRIERLIKIAALAAQYPTLKSVFNRSVHGFRGRNSLVELITLAPEEDQAMMWAKVFTIFTSKGDTEKLEEWYQKGCELYPEEKEYLTTYFVQGICKTQPERALALIFDLTDLKQQAYSFKEFVFNTLSDHEFALRWRASVDKLVSLEEVILQPADFSITDLDEDGSVSSQDGENIPKTVLARAGWLTDQVMTGRAESPYSSQVPGLLANLAKLSLERGEWVAFNDIMQDTRLSGWIKIRLMVDLNEWLFSDDKEFEYR
jgi:hypothetical protein